MAMSNLSESQPGGNFLRRKLPAFVLATMGVFALNGCAVHAVPGQPPVPATKTYNIDPSSPVSTHTRAPEQSQAGANETSDDEARQLKLPRNIETASHDQFYAYGLAAAEIMFAKFGEAQPAQTYTTGGEDPELTTEIFSADDKMQATITHSSSKEPAGWTNVQITYVEFNNDSGETKGLTVSLERTREGVDNDRKMTVAGLRAAIEDGEFRTTRIDYIQGKSAGEVYPKDKDNTLKVALVSGGVDDAAPSIESVIGDIDNRPR